MTGPDEPGPLLPDYRGACLSNLIPAITSADRSAAWLPERARRARQIVVLVLDGLGWDQLQAHRDHAPFLASMEGGPITSVAPTTTATALASITLGMTPAEHGVVGYRVAVGDGAVLNVLRWRTADGDARQSFPALAFQSRRAFGDRAVPVITRAEFIGTGFTDAHLNGASIVGWGVPSSIAVEVRRALEKDAPLVYAYYDGVDKTAHGHGFGEHYEAELRAVDALVADIATVLPPAACLLVTADHGQVSVGDRIVDLDGDLLRSVRLQSGEGRFRWLHAVDGEAGRVGALARELYSDRAWVRTRAEAVAEGWFGGALAPAFAPRIGDVALAARDDISFADPGDSGSAHLVCRHGSLTRAEMLVPLVATGPVES